MKKKIAVFGNAWSTDYVTGIISELKKETAKQNIDLVAFINHTAWGSSEVERQAEIDFLRFPRFEHFDGVMFLGNTIGHPLELEYLETEAKRTHVPCVSFSYEFPGLPCVVADNFSGMYELVTHLIREHNVCHPVFISGPVSHQESNIRKEAFLKACEDCNIPAENVVVYTGNWSESGAQDITNNHLATGRKTDAFICANDSMAMGTTRALFKANYSLPDDMIVTGFDNTEAGLIMSPRLTSITVDYKAMAKRGIELLLRQMDGEDVPLVNKFATLPVIRESCGCAFTPSEEERARIMHNSVAFRTESVMSQDIRFRSLYRLLRLNDTWEDVNHSLLYHYRQNIASGQKSMGILVGTEVKDREYQKYPTECKLICGYHHGTVLPMQDLDLFPSLYRFMNEEPAPQTLIMTPLHMDGPKYGIAILEWQDNAIREHTLYVWTRHLGQSIDLVIHNIQIRELTERLDALSRTDALTGVYNRTGCEQNSKELLESAGEAGNSVALIMVDIDRMKQINDDYGHTQGDLAINLVAQTLKEVFPKDYIISRYGGDEFLVVGVCNIRELMDLYISQAEATLSAKADASKIPFPLTISIGGYLKTPYVSMSFASCIDAADQELYITKQKHHQND